MWKTKVEAGSKEEFLKKAAEVAPLETALHFPALLSYAERKYRDTPEAYVFCEMTCQREQQPELMEWVQTYLRSPHQGRPKSLILWGPTLIGKTLWARSLGTHAYFPGLFMLEGFNATESQYAILTFL